jgi:hypothetical protein
MPSSPVPLKTALGQEELRARQLKLGQRYRTVLLLVDGRRPLSEVLALARQAGAATSHFEDLVRLGLVELPELWVAPDAVETAPGALEPKVHTLALDVPVLTDVAELAGAKEASVPIDSTEVTDFVADVDIEVDAAPAEPVVQKPSATDRVLATVDTGFDPERTVWTLPFEDVPAPRNEPTFTEVRSIVAPVVTTSEPPRFDPETTGVWNAPFDNSVVDAVAVVDEVDAIDRPVAAPRAQAHKSLHKLRKPALHGEHPAEPVLDESLPTLPPTPDQQPAPLPPEEEAALRQVRERLSETLRFNAPLFTARTLIRVRMAKTRRDLIQLVWEIEHHLNHSRRPRSDAQGLHDARELLGMGNTHVAGESQPNWTEEDV